MEEAVTASERSRSGSVAALAGQSSKKSSAKVPRLLAIYPPSSLHRFQANMPACFFFFFLSFFFQFMLHVASFSCGQRKQSWLLSSAICWSVARPVGRNKKPLKTVGWSSRRAALTSWPVWSAKCERSFFCFATVFIDVQCSGQATKRATASCRPVQSLRRLLGSSNFTKALLLSTRPAGVVAVG